MFTVYLLEMTQIKNNNRELRTFLVEKKCKENLKDG